MVRTRVGYTGGTTADPTYHQIGDHSEALQIDFDPEQIGFDDLLACFWSSRDHSRPAFSRQYRAAVFAADDDQLDRARQAAEAWALERGLEVQTAVERLDGFYRAEDYHQKYRLRREADLTGELVARYGSDRAMVDATAAARINGLIGGYVKRGEIDRLLPRLALSPEGQRRLRGCVHE